MSDRRKKLGEEGENEAREYLENRGFIFLAKNLRLKVGEIDLLMQDKKTLVIVEVKTKSDESFGLPQEMVNYKKKNKLVLLAKTLSQLYPENEIRIDVVAINESNRSIEHFISAVEEE